MTATAQKFLAGAALAVLGVALTASATLAQTAQPTQDSSGVTAGDASRPEEIVVTGSLIRRPNLESASPLDVLTAKDIARSGFDTVASVLSNLTSNGQGTLSNNNSEAFAGGASGVALRGLTVGATLVLVDGHRVAPYPLSDDGQRQFVDIESIPVAAIDGIDVLKDGASAIYGSDAIAGVVNIHLKKQFTGLEASAEYGNSQHGGGESERATLSYGTGDLGRDGWNAYVIGEFRNQAPVYLRQRQYQSWGNLDFSRIGGNDVRLGAPNSFNAGLPATLTPYLVNPTTNGLTFLGNGCSTAQLGTVGGNNSGCTFTSPQKLISPTRNFNLVAGLTRDFGEGWQAKLRLSFFDSEGQQSNANYQAYPGASYGGNDSNPHTGIATPGIGAIADYSVPANYLGSGSAPGSYLEGIIAGVGLPTIDIDSKTYRAALDVTGNPGGWDVSASVGFSEVVTDMRFKNYVNYNTLYTDLTTLDASGKPMFNPLGGNSASVIESIAPAFTNHATDRLLYAEASASRKVTDLPGGDLTIAAGAQVVSKDLNNPGPAPVLAGTIGGTFSTFASGKQTFVAEYAEVNARLFHLFDIDAAVRDDYYDTYGNSIVPKIGVRFTPLGKLLVLRGTYSRGFRAPAPAEFGNAATVFGLGGIADQILCGNGLGQVPAQCSAAIGFVQTTTPKLQPEKSESFTGGAVLQPTRNWSITLDYYHIKLSNQIISQSTLPTYAFNDTTCKRGPNLPISGVVVGTNPDGTPILGTATPLAGPLAACFSGYVNAQSTVTSGLDVQSGYKVRVGGAQITASAEWTHLFSYDLTGPNGVAYKLAGTHGPSGVSGDTGNPRDRINASIGVDVGRFSAALSGYWVSGFSVIDPSASGGAQTTCALAWNAATALAFTTPSAINQQYCRVKSFTSVNLVTSYKITQRVGLSLTVENLLDQDAPLDASTYGGSFTPVNPALHGDGILGRFFRVGMNVKY